MKRNNKTPTPKGKEKRTTDVDELVKTQYEYFKKVKELEKLRKTKEREREIEMLQEAIGELEDQIQAQVQKSNY